MPCKCRITAKLLICLSNQFRSKSHLTSLKSTHLKEIDYKEIGDPIEGLRRFVHWTHSKFLAKTKAVSAPVSLRFCELCHTVESEKVNFFSCLPS